MKRLPVIPLLIIPFLTGPVNKITPVQFLPAAAAPAIDVLDVQPSDASGNVYYMTCVPAKSGAKSTAQLSVSFKIKNKESKPLVLNNIIFSYINNGIQSLKIMVLDIDSLPVKKMTIPSGGSFTWQNSRDYHEVDNAVFFNTPFPASLQIRLSFDGYAEPFIINKNLKSYTNNATGGAYGFPGKEADLRMNEYWYGYGGHGGGSQFYAYDIKVVGWDDKAKKWSSTFPGKDGSKNEDYRAYGKTVVSVCDGKVIDFGDGVKENIGNSGGGSGGGNWFKINNGKETICYYHMQPGSLNKSLMVKGANVKKGDKLGLLGNAGGSSEPHVHVHAIEDADKDGQGQWLPMNLSGIYVIDLNELSGGPDPAAGWSKTDKKGLPFLQDRRCAIWPSSGKPCWYPGGWAEIARHGIPENKYQDEFMKIYNCGYYPVWVDGYDVGGKTFFNVIFRYNSNNYPVQVRHNMTKQSFQAEYDNWVKSKGYRLLQLDNYLDQGQLKFAAIFMKKPGQPQQQPAYHGVTPEQHQALFDKYTGDGFVPVNVSVTSVGGKRYYSAFYEKRNVGGAVLKSFLSQQEYQDMFNDMKQKKWEQVYINAYHHDGQTRFSVIWYKNPGFNSYSATRKSDSGGYQDKYDTNTGNGFLTQCVTGYDEGGKHWFAAQWTK